MLRLVSDHPEPLGPMARLLALADRLQSKAVELDSHAARAESETAAEDLQNAAELSRRLAANLRHEIELIASRKPVR